LWAWSRRTWAEGQGGSNESTSVHAQHDTFHIGCGSAVREPRTAFLSVGEPTPDFLAGKKGTPITLAGHLRAPKESGKHPTVVLLHGSEGIGGYNGPAGGGGRGLKP